MTAVRRHIRDQHKKNVKRCDKCVQYSKETGEFEAHKAFGNCTREGIQKGQGQMREWKALYTALHPGATIPRTPFYDNHSSTPVSQRRTSPVEGAQSATASDVEGKDSDRHRQVALQTLDILRHNIIIYSMASTQPGEQTMINVVQALLPLIQQTSQVSAQETQSSAMLGTVTGRVVQAQSTETSSDVGSTSESLPGTENASIGPLVITEDWLQLDLSNGFLDSFNFQNDLFHGH